MTAQQLKNSILQMAVQGKLVPQDPNDEPASVLLERIRAEKEKLIREGKIKREKNPSVIFRGEDNMPYEKIENNPPVCIAEEVPFEIPESWAWVRLADLVAIYTGKKDANFGTPNGKYDFFTCSNEPIRSTTYSYDGEYLIMPGNGANIGLVIYYHGKFEAYQRTYLLENIHDINLTYVKYHLEFNWKSYNTDKMYGSAIPYIKLRNLQNYLVAIPPVKEQSRIVDEIERYLLLVQSYEYKELDLARLDKAFPALLKKSILQQAVMGKLVPQDETDEPASVLLDRIRVEKQALVKAGKIKKDKHESVIYRRDNSHYEKLDGVE
ncbi:MAG: restriction endonuclease subunit S, partial [Planctomycetia bacterium]|nr:restriction endonuclease subunit S [Planctomycetia bacterium]